MASSRTGRGCTWGRFCRARSGPGVGFEKKSSLYVLELYPYTLQPHPNSAPKKPYTEPLCGLLIFQCPEVVSHTVSSLQRVSILPFFTHMRTAHSRFHTSQSAIRPRRGAPRESRFALRMGDACALARATDATAPESKCNGSRSLGCCTARTSRRAGGACTSCSRGGGRGAALRSTLVGMRSERS